MFSEELKRARKRAGKTQVQLAAELGVSNGTVAMWETGKREPDYEMLRRIAETLDTTSGVLLGEAGILELVAADNGLKNAMQFFDDEREEKEKTPAETGGGISFPENVPYINDDEESLLNLYRKLNQEGKEKLYGYADDLVSSGKYIKTDTDRMVQGKK